MQTFAQGKVLEVINEQTAGSSFDEASQTVLVDIVTGPDNDQVVTIEYIMSAANFEHQKVGIGDTVILAKVDDARGDNYYIIDEYRLDSVLIYAVLFVAAAVFFGRMRGLGSLLGLATSLGVLMLFVVPRIIAGDNPFIISMIGASVIAVVSIVLAHGFKKRTAVALAATLTTLGLACIMSYLAVHFGSLSGTGTEEAVYLQLGYLPNLDLVGLFLGAVIIGVLGVLDDVTTAQVAAVEEIQEANKKLEVKELYRRGLSVGREHIAALVNTLILAYAGAAFPLFMLFALPDHPPLWVVLNGENIVEEIIRALVGGVSLMLAVPISTAYAAAFFGTQDK